MAGKQTLTTTLTLVPLLQRRVGGVRYWTAQQSTNSDSLCAVRHHRKRLPHSAQPSAPKMSAEAAALQQLRGLIAALAAGELAALSEATVSSLRAAANSVARLARAGASELSRGCWEAALELWCVIPLCFVRSAAPLCTPLCAQRRSALGCNEDPMLWLRCGAWD